MDWARRYILFHGKRHPASLGADDVTAFLTHLAVDRTVAPATQNQAKAALLFLYRQVLGIELPWLDEVISAKASRHLPVVLTPGEVRALLNELDDTMGLVAALLYGTGLRLLEGLRLRVNDVEFQRRELLVRHGKGGKDRVTMLPENLLLPLQGQLARAKALHDDDLAAGFGSVWLPDALAVKYPRAAQAWGWQWVFPSAQRSADPRAPGAGLRRHHLNESSVQKAVAGGGAGRRTGDDRALRLRGDLDVLDLARRHRNGKPVLAQAFEMELDGLADLGFELHNAGACRHAPGKIGDVGRIVACCLLDHDGVTHRASLLQTRLLQDAVQRARGEVIARLPRNSDATGLGGVLELAVTSAGCNEMPPILLQQAKDFADFHRQRISGEWP